VTSGGAVGGSTVTTAVDPPTAGRIARWLADRGVEVREPLRFAVVPGGRSNLTYRVTDAAGGRWILRRPPLSSLHASAHDVLREHRIMAALRPSAVPVPDMVGAEPRPDLIGAPFFVMAYVDGTVLADQATAERALEPAARARAGESIVDLLATLHAVDPAAVGLADLGRGGDYLGRQLRRWGGQLDRLDDDGRMRAVLHRLRASPPEQGDVAIVHGDFRPGNMIVGSDGTVRALLDWELCTLGDPLADLGWLLAYWGSGTEVALPLSVPTRAAGFPSREAVLERYARRSGRAVHDVGYYVAFALWRLAVILAGVRARTRDGAYGAPAADATLEERVATVVAAADAATRAAGR
jgi:aminoglycoside phosphotransferase (APT) family kinase protein